MEYHIAINFFHEKHLLLQKNAFNMLNENNIQLNFWYLIYTVELNHVLADVD